MTLFEFLLKVTKEKYPYRLRYAEATSCVEVDVDAFSEKWLVTFDEDGFVDFSTYQTHNIEVNENEQDVMDLFNRPRKAWLDAARDLDIAFISPFKFMGTDGKYYQVTGLLPQFGAENGTIVTSRLDDERAVFEAEKLDNYIVPSLNPIYYDCYERTLFVQTLEGWDWFAESEPPSWFCDD